jgi:hypothetical protein
MWLRLRVEHIESKISIRGLGPEVLEPKEEPNWVLISPRTIATEEDGRNCEMVVGVMDGGRYTQWRVSPRREIEME